jgi:hypothetical protein
MVRRARTTCAGRGKAAADALPDARYRTLQDQAHDVAPKALAPVLTQFFL